MRKIILILALFVCALSFTGTDAYYSSAIILAAIVPSKSRGIQLTTTAGAGTETTVIVPSKSDGDIIGISAAEPYARVDMSRLLITVTQGEEKPLVSVPLSQLIPDGERHFYPLNLSKDGGNISVDLESITDNSLVANKPVIILHYSKERCKD